MIRSTTIRNPLGLALRVAPIILVLALGLAPSPAEAGPPGTLTKLNTTEVGNINEVGLSRTADGVLHVIWRQENPDGLSADLMHATVQPNGTVSAPNPVVTGWNFIDAAPDLVLTPAGDLQAFFGGIRSTTPGETFLGLNSAVSVDEGQTWMLVGSGAIATGSGQFGGPVSAAFAPDATPLEATGGYVHRGLDPNTTNHSYFAQFGTCCATNSKLAVDDATSEMWHAWYMFGDATGAYVQQVDLASGAPTGASLSMPGSVTDYQGTPYSSDPGRRLSLTARSGGDLYMAFNGGYPNLTDVWVWRVGDPTSYRIARYAAGLEDSAIAMAASPDGRMWALWGTESIPAKVYASVSDDTVSAWSPPATFKVFKGDEYGDIYGIQANASAGRLDVFVNTATVSDLGLYHTQIDVPAEWTDGPDDLNGTGGADFIYGGGGGDDLSGAGGKDQMYGGGGGDKLDGGKGKDLLNGGKGYDVCIKGKGDGDTAKGCERVVTRRHR